MSFLNLSNIQDAANSAATTVKTQSVTNAANALTKEILPTSTPSTKPVDTEQPASQKSGDTWFAFNLPQIGGNTSTNGAPVLTSQQQKDRQNTIIAIVVVVVLFGVVAVLAMSGKKSKK